MTFSLSLFAPYWRAIVTVAAPLILSLIPIISNTAEARCGYVIIVMAIYWMTEALPLAVTALIPVFAFPLLGILSTGDVCLVYMKETNMMFLGGLTVAIAVEHCNLHKRVALFIILHIGQSPRRLMAGFMLTTMFLSMWISNTASTAMMVPIVDAILQELYKFRTSDKKKDNIELAPTQGIDNPVLDVSEAELSDENEVTEDSTADNDTNGISNQSSYVVYYESQERNREKETIFVTEYQSPPSSDTNQEYVNVLQETNDATDNDLEGQSMRLMLFFSVMYGADVGGTGVITGTGPNMVLKEYLETEYCEPTGLNFASWMGFNIPGMLICVLLAWGWLQIIFIGCSRNGLGDTSPEKEHAVKKLLRQKYNDLGRMTYHEATVLTLFIILVLLWLFRAPEFVPGWSQWFKDAYGIKVGDATPAMLIVFLLFILPAELNFWCFRDKNDSSPPKSSPACMTWEVVQTKVPWGIVLLLGGGFAMAEATKKSNLDDWIGSQLTYFNVMPKELIVFVVCLMTAMLTEVASNTATASILMPVLNKMAVGIGVNPLYLMLPAAVTCSYAFMLPVATPPNAIVFGAANMKSKDMMRAGVVMNVICVCVITVMINTLGVAMFDLNTVPSWINNTAPCAEAF